MTSHSHVSPLLKPVRCLTAGVLMEKQSIHTCGLRARLDHVKSVTQVRQPCLQCWQQLLATVHKGLHKERLWYTANTVKGRMGC
jgi:hypothetical protein